MAIFGSLFGSSRKIFHTKDEIKKSLFRLNTLTQDQREIIFNIVAGELDDNGVTEFEWKKRLSPIFYQLVKEGKISQIDYEKLKNLGN
ncbi:MAG: hypothetical protein WC310_03215 [Patescibacteria group bacterium]|jgi:hypothetical protein